MLRHPGEDRGFVPFGIDFYDAELLLCRKARVEAQGLYLNSGPIRGGADVRMAGVDIAPFLRVKNPCAICTAQRSLHCDDAAAAELPLPTDYVTLQQLE